MERVSRLLSWTLSRFLWLSGPSERGAARQPRIMEEKALEVYDLIRTIRDPEKPNTLEELEAVTESCVEVQEINEDDYLVIIRFKPTVPHCSLATLIGLCLKLQQCLPFKHKLEIYISEGTHSTEEDINKQINDKERVAAAMENPNLQEIMEQCVLEPD
ncbi:hypothetical protein AB1E18_011674 [Capra hircus]